MSITSAPIYHDLQGLSTLRAEARNTPSNAIGEVATQFESLFVQMMLKSMREATATLDGGLFSSDQMEMYQQMFDQQVSLDLSREGVLGLSDILVQQLGGERPHVSETENAAAINSLPTLPNDIRRQALGVFPSSNKVMAAISSVESGDKAHLTDWRPSSAEEFIRDVWSHAVEATKRLDLDPAVLVAQSALETGWGKKVIQATNGGSSFNLFGIKAGAGWRGETSIVNTLEFRGGVSNLEKAAFRVYDSLGSSFSDYVDFLKINPRYQQALEKVADKQEFLVELQDAGYATDPAYAEKILGILGKSSFGSVINSLRNLQ